MGVRDFTYVTLAYTAVWWEVQTLQMSPWPTKLGIVVDGTVCEVGSVTATLWTGVVTIGHGGALGYQGTGGAQLLILTF